MCRGIVFPDGRRADTLGELRTIVGADKVRIAPACEQIGWRDDDCLCCVDHHETAKGLNARVRFAPFDWIWCPDLKMTWSGRLYDMPKCDIILPSTPCSTGIGFEPPRDAVEMMLPPRYHAAWRRASIWHDTTAGRPEAERAPPHADLEHGDGRLIARLFFTPVTPLLHSPR